MLCVQINLTYKKLQTKDNPYGLCSSIGKPNSYLVPDRYSQKKTNEKKHKIVILIESVRLIVVFSKKMPFQKHHLYLPQYVDKHFFSIKYK